MLAILVVILIIAVGRQVGNLLSTDGAGSSLSRSAFGRKGDAEPGPRTPLPEVEELHLELLQAGEGVRGEGRDPFQIRPPAPVPKPRPKETVREALNQDRERNKSKTVAPVRPARPTPPPVDVVYLGSFGSQRNRLAVFSDGKEIFNVPQGQVLKDKFVVMRIGFESADLGFVGFPDSPAQRLEIGG